jgi:hypothetical protein
MDHHTGDKMNAPCAIFLAIIMTAATMLGYYNPMTFDQPTAGQQQAAGSAFVEQLEYDRTHDQDRHNRALNYCVGVVGFTGERIDWIAAKRCYDTL